MRRRHVRLVGPSLRSVDETKAIKTALISAQAGAGSMESIAARMAGYSGLPAHVAEVLNSRAVWNYVRAAG